MGGGSEWEAGERQWDAGPGGPVGARSGAVTAVGVINLVLGGLMTICGLVAMFAVALIFGAASEASKQAGQLGDQKAAQAASGLGGMLAGLGAAVGVIILVVAALYILAGIGVLKRKGYGRIITLILGGFMGFGAIMSLLSIGSAPGQAILNILIDGGYCVFVYVVLLNAQNAAEFR